MSKRLPAFGVLAVGVIVLVVLFGQQPIHRGPGIRRADRLVPANHDR